MSDSNDNKRKLTDDDKRRLRALERMLEQKWKDEESERKARGLFKVAVHAISDLTGEESPVDAHDPELDIGVRFAAEIGAAWGRELAKKK